MADLPNIRFDLETARRLAGEMADHIRPACEKLAVAGSIRRGEPYVKDAELIALPKGDVLAVTDDLLATGVIGKAVYGESGTTRWGPKYRGMLYRWLKVELFLADADNWGYQLWLRSGPATANTYLMKWLSWKNAPVRAKDGYWWHGETRLSVPDEETLFTLLGMPYLPPGERSERRYKQLLEWNRAHRWPDFSAFYIKAPEQTRLPFAAFIELESRHLKAGEASVTISPFLLREADTGDWQRQVYREAVNRTANRLAYFRHQAGVYSSYARAAERLERDLEVLRRLTGLEAGLSDVKSP